MYNKLFKVQQEIGKMVKGKDNPFFKSKYFDINLLLEKLMPLLAKYKIVLLQPLTMVDNKPALTTMLIDLEETDEKKQLIAFSTSLPETDTAQKMGGAITYVRRYAIQSLFALQAEDDDGNEASKKTQPKSEPKDASIEL